MSVAALPELIGSQVPRIESVPPWVTTVADDAVELAALVGVTLDPWQHRVLQGALGQTLTGRWSAPEVGLVIPRQQGKSFCLSTPILTEAGWATIGDIRPGDHVYGPDGSLTMVMACSEIFHDLDCYEIEFTDGARYTVAGDHLWLVKDKNHREFTSRGRPVLTDEWQALTTRHMASRIGGPRRDNGRNEFRYRVRCDAVPDTPEVELPIDPYLLGYWLGDGNARAAVLTCGQQDLEWLLGRLELAAAHVDRVVPDRCGFAIGFRITDKWSRSGFRSRARSLGVLGDKHIPEVYLAASPKQRGALLAGLLDSDGSIGMAGRSPQVEFSTSIPRLAETFHRLVRSLGIRVIRRDGTGSLSAVPKRTRARFRWTPTFNPFEMPRKSVRFQPPASDRHELMSIVAIRRVPPVPTRCIQVARPDGMYLVGHLFTPTHNSVIIEIAALTAIYLQHLQIVYTAHLMATSRKMRERIQQLIESCPDLDREVKQIRVANEEQSIELKSRARIDFVARSASSARGWSGDMVFMDEAFAVADDHIGALMPIMFARWNWQLWYASSAGKPASHVLRRIRARGIDGDPGLAYYEWSINEEAYRANPDEVAADPRMWAVANPSLGIRTSRHTLTLAQRSMDDVEFAREVLGVWDDPRGAPLIDPIAWARLVDPGSQIRGAVVFALDVSPQLESGAISVAGVRDDGLTHVEITGRDGQLDHRPGVDWIVARVAELNEQWEPSSAWVLDPSGPAGALLVDLRDAGIEVQTVTARELAQACGGMLKAASMTPDTSVLRHLGQLSLNDAIRAAKKRDIGDGGWAFGRRVSNEDISPLVAATLAVHGLALHAEARYDVLKSVF